MNPNLRKHLITSIGLPLRWLVAIPALALCSQLARSTESPAMVPIAESQVQVGGLIGERIAATVTNNLFQLNLDGDFIKPFQEKNGSGLYIGMGKLVETVARLAAYTQDARVEALRQKIIEALIRSQDADGYIGALKPANRVWKTWDGQEMSDLIYGLLIDYDLVGEQRSLNAAKRLGDYFLEARLEDARNGNVKRNALKFNQDIGIEMAAVSLYQHTRDARYLDFCLTYLKMPEWNKEITVGWNPAKDGHDYTYLNKCFAQLQLYQLRPDERLLQASRRALGFLTRSNGMVITGSSGEQEHWNDTQEGTINLAETCTTTYLIRWLNELFKVESNPLYGDLMERIIYNSLFGAQSPDGRQICYYLPFEGQRHYFGSDTYCCPNSYRKIISELPTMIYFRHGDGIMVNHYVSSIATVPLARTNRISVQQVTDYPRSGHVEIALTVPQACRFPLWLRIPAWCHEARVAVNSGAAQPTIPGLLKLDREWRTGDRVLLDLPMTPRLVKGRATQMGRAAVVCGPVVFGVSRQDIQCAAEKRKDLYTITDDPQKMDLRTIFVQPSSLAGPLPSEKNSGPVCRIRGWSPGRFVHKTPNLLLTLAPHASPATEAIYFKVPDRKDVALVDDELLSGK